MNRIKDAIRYFKFGANQGAIPGDYARLAIEGMELLDQIQRQQATVCGYSLQELVMVAQMMEDLELHPAEIHQMCKDMKKMYETLLLFSTMRVTRTITGNHRAVRQYPDFRTVMNAMKGGKRYG